MSDTLFHNVRVLAIGQLIEAHDGKKLAEGNTATLELTPHRRSSWRWRTPGEISLSLRSIADIDAKDGPAEGQARRHDQDPQVRSESASVWRQLSVSVHLKQCLQEGWQTMRMTFRGMVSALLLAGVGIWASSPAALAQGRAAERSGEILDNSFWRVPANANFPLTPSSRPPSPSVKLGLGKSFMVEFPFELKDVVISAPDKVDAVVQSSNRVFLVAKAEGQTNAFFFDTRGQQMVRLDIRVGADIDGLSDVLKRFVPGSSIQAEMRPRPAVVLSGTVPGTTTSTASAPPTCCRSPARGERRTWCATAPPPPAPRHGWQRANVNTNCLPRRD